MSDAITCHTGGRKAYLGEGVEIPDGTLLERESSRIVRFELWSASLADDWGSDKLNRDCTASAKIVCSNSKTSFSPFLLPLRATMSPPRRLLADCEGVPYSSPALSWRSVTRVRREASGYRLLSSA